MNIRDAHEADLPSIVEIYNASIPGRAATADTEPVTVQSRRQWFAEHDPSSRPLWVLEVDTQARRVGSAHQSRDRLPKGGQCPPYSLEVDTQDGKQIAAWISLRDFYGRPAYHATVEIAFYVAPEFQGQGFASTLLEHLIDRAAQLGIKNLLSFVFAHNQASLHLSKKFGFEQWGYLPGVAELDGQLRDLIIFGLKVPGA